MELIFYTVKSGDTLSGIGRMFDMTVEELARLNGIVDPDRIYAGQQLRVKAPCAYKWYVVREGDTLYSIARKYDTTVEELAAMNGISNPDAIFIGQILRVR